MGNAYRVELTDPEKLRNILESYLGLGVCPVRASPLPPPMAQVEVEIVLPGGRSQIYRGTVIRHSGPHECLVQMSGVLDLVLMRKLALDAMPSSEEVVPEPEPAQEAAGGPGERPSETVDAYRQIQSANVAEKQKLARSGNQVMRNLLIRDRIKNVHVFVLMNPRITSEEVAEYSKLAGLSKDAIQMIVGNRVWSSSSQVVMNLVRNPATPQDLLPGLLRRLGQSQLRILAKSSDVRSQVSALARKLLFG